jgi:hypothetical protein
LVIGWLLLLPLVAASSFALLLSGCCRRCWLLVAGCYQAIVIVSPCARWVIVAGLLGLLGFCLLHWLSVAVCSFGCRLVGCCCCLLLLFVIGLSVCYWLPPSLAGFVILLLLAWLACLVTADCRFAGCRFVVAGHCRQPSFALLFACLFRLLSLAHCHCLLSSLVIALVVVAVAVIIAAVAGSLFCRRRQRSSPVGLSSCCCIL